MNKFLTDKVNNLQASATLAMAAKARELKSKGIDVIGLSLGEPDFNIPDFIKEAAINAINDNYNSYTPVDGYVDLKKAISRKFSRDNNLNYSISQIVVSTGGGIILKNKDLLKQTFNIYLKCDLETLIKRTSRNKNRPLLKNNVEKNIKILFNDRKEIYNEISDFTINATSNTQKTIKTILERLN